MPLTMMFLINFFFLSLSFISSPTLVNLNLYNFITYAKNIMCESRVRRVELVIEPGQSLGLMIRGGVEYGLGIYVTGVDKDSVADRAGLSVRKIKLNLQKWGKLPFCIHTTHVSFKQNNVFCSSLAGRRPNIGSQWTIIHECDPR
jgi:hypothetical protein